MSADYIARLHRVAARQGKSARMTVVFPDYIAEVIVRKR